MKYAAQFVVHSRVLQTKIICDISNFSVIFRLFSPKTIVAFGFRATSNIAYLK